MTVASAILSKLPRPAARWTRVLGLSVLVGIAGGLAAAALEEGLRLGTPLLVGRFAHLSGAGVWRPHWGVLFLPAAGGLVAGTVVWLLCPRAIGHGTDVLTRAFHRQMGDLPVRGPLVKAVAAIGVIVCGGSTGPEGPIAALGAAMGSTLGKAFRLTPRERRILLLAGCGAGIGAIFRCPLGGALFATGILYQEPEFESEAIVPSFIASVVGYSTYMLFHGFGEFMLKGANQLVFDSPKQLIPYAILGPLCGLFAALLSICVRTVEERIVHRARWPRWLMPGVGGLATGAIACVFPQVMDSQYHFIQNAMNGQLFSEAPDVSWWWWTGLFGAVAIFRCVATATTVGSGAPGGVLGPCVFIGGVAGAFVGAAGEALIPGMIDESLRKALIPVGMAGVLAASMRVPIAALVMTTEMTGSYGLIVPLMLVCSSAYVVGRRWGLNREQVRTASASPAHAADGIMHMLESRRVDDLMDRDWPLRAGPNVGLRDLVEHIPPGTRPVFAIVDGERIVGLISVADIRRVMEEPHLADALIASDMMTEQLAVAYPDQDLYEALDAFRDHHHDVLPVVSRDGRRWLGMLTREHIFDALKKMMEETHKFVLREYVGLAAMEQEGQLQQLVMGVAPMQKDRIQRLLVPLQAIGKSLRETDFRRQFGAQVIAVQMPDGTLQCPPDIDAPLNTQQRLVAVVGPKPAAIAPDSLGAGGFAPGAHS